MTIEKAKKELPNFNEFRKAACVCCTSEDYCPSDCDMLIKARRMDFERILKSYVRNDGEMWKVMRYIKRARI